MKKDQHTLFIDIETVSQFSTLGEASEEHRKCWEKKAKHFHREECDAESLYREKAGIFAEFAKVIVIGLGYFTPDREEFRCTAIYGDDEKTLLEEFIQLLNEGFETSSIRFCGHNGKEFDYPFLARRIVANGLVLPAPLQLMGKKPWENPHFDTLEMWKFGDYKHFVSLDTLAMTLGLPSSKTDIDGSQVHEAYYEEQDLERIAEYCKQDVILTARVFEKLTNHKSISDQSIALV
jgi:uncharacterized protein YprB with RNaseH-like and TPR domain